MSTKVNRLRLAATTPRTIIAAQIVVAELYIPLPLLQLPIHNNAESVTAQVNAQHAMAVAFPVPDIIISVVHAVVVVVAVLVAEQALPE